MKKAAGAINRFKNFEEADDSLNCCKLFLTAMLFSAVIVTFAGNFLYYLNSPYVYIDVLKEEPTMDNVVGYSCDCLNPVQNYFDFISLNDVEMCPIPPYSTLLPEYIDLLICETAVKSFSQKLIEGRIYSTRYLNYTELELFLFNEWKLSVFSVWSSAS